MQAQVIDNKIYIFPETTKEIQWMQRTLPIADTKYPQEVLLLSEKMTCSVYHQQGEAGNCLIFEILDSPVSRN